MKRKAILSVFMAMAALLSSGQGAHAVLGGGADSVAADRKALQAAPRATTARSGYTVEEIVSDAATVREYVSPSGVVFGIAWNGYVHPDLMLLLGSYWGEYSAARQKAARNPGRTRQRIATENIVVEKWGHMRNLQGRAYAPDLVPAGVRVDEIK